jgi:hypothetical protein
MNRLSSENCYIFHHQSAKFRSSIHVWISRKCSEYSRTNIMMHASLIAQRQAADGQPPMDVFRERQDYETSSFLTLFRKTGLFVLVGHRSQNGSGGRNLRLFRCVGRRVIYAREVPCTESVLVKDGVYLLENRVKSAGRGGKRKFHYFLWWGAAADWSTIERAKALSERLKGKGTVSIVNDGDSKAETDFLFLLGDESKKLEDCKFASCHYTASDIVHFGWSNQLRDGAPALFKLRMLYSTNGSECRLERVPLLRVVFRGETGNGLLSRTTAPSLITLSHHPLSSLILVRCVALIAPQRLT